MAQFCTRCEGTGFLNINQIPDEDLYNYENSSDFYAEVLAWIDSHDDHEVQVCDCCGDGYGWYGIAGEHYNSEDPVGNNGPYAYNGGLCECH